MVDPNTLGIIAAMSVATVSGPAAPITAPIAYGICLIGGSIALGFIFYFPGAKAGNSRW